MPFVHVSRARATIHLQTGRLTDDETFLSTSLPP